MLKRHHRGRTQDPAVPDQVGCHPSIWGRRPWKDGQIEVICQTAPRRWVFFL